MRFTKRTIDLCKEGYDHLIEVANDYFKIHEGTIPDFIHITSINDNYISCKGIIDRHPYDKDYEMWINIPIEYLWIEDWIDIERAKIFKKNMQAFSLHEQKKLKQKQELEHAERELFLSLHAKYQSHEHALSNFIDGTKQMYKPLGNEFIDRDTYDEFVKRYNEYHDK